MIPQSGRESVSDFSMATELTLEVQRQLIEELLQASQEEKCLFPVSAETIVVGIREQRIWVASVKGEFAGVSVIDHISESWSNVTTVYVKPDYRGQDLAAGLLG